MLVDRAPLSDDEEGGLQSAIRGERSEQSNPAHAYAMARGGSDQRQYRHCGKAG
jgi:hypothetical protein